MGFRSCRITGTSASVGGLADLAEGTADEWSRLIESGSTARFVPKEDQIALRGQPFTFLGWFDAPGSRRNAAGTAC